MFQSDVTMFLQNPHISPSFKKLYQMCFRLQVITGQCTALLLKSVRQVTEPQ